MKSSAGCGDFICCCAFRILTVVMVKLWVTVNICWFMGDKLLHEFMKVIAKMAIADKQ